MTRLRCTSARPTRGDRARWRRRRGYFDVKNILEVAAQAGCNVLHPGYGFLSESPQLAHRCAEVGVRFIGPPPRRWSC
jgi:acetyl/propionyl-CoA carboxylase alpha subunit